MTGGRPLNLNRSRAVARRFGGIVIGLSVLATVLATAQAADTAARVAEFRRLADASAAEASGLEARRPAVISGSIVMNTVRQFPRKQELDGYLAERTTEARAWESKVAAGAAQRTRVLNPYTGSTYTKYYDDKGDWQFSVIENDYRATEKLQEDWSREFRRARATLEGLQREYDDLVADGGLQAAQRSELAAMLTSATERVGQFGSPPPELLPRPVEGDANSPHPSYRVFDGLTGKLIEIGPPAGEQRRPVAGAAPAGGAGPGGSPSPPAAAGKPQAAASPLIGTWSGKYIADEVTDFELVFSPDGTMQMRLRGLSLSPTFEFRWRQDAGGNHAILYERGYDFPPGHTMFKRGKDAGWVPVEFLDGDTVRWKNNRIPGSFMKFTRR